MRTKHEIKWTNVIILPDLSGVICGLNTHLQCNNHMDCLLQTINVIHYIIYDLRIEFKKM